MSKNRNRKFNNRNNNNNNQQKNVEQKPVFQFNKNNYEDAALEREKQKSIQELKSRQIVCPKCGEPITDIASALTDKASDSPMHFDCAMEEIQKNEKLSQNEKIAYIGHGRFGVLYFENPRDQRKFTIKKIIEWESKEDRADWRNEISSLYSQTN